MMGELAQRYPAQSLVVSTGAYAQSTESDRQFPQIIDRATIRATRLRTINGLALWTARASRLERRHHFGFAWCGELKPAGYPAWWLMRRYGVPYGVVVHGTELLLLDHKIGQSRFKRWTASGLVAGATVLVANSTWTASLARRIYGRLDRPDLAARVRVVPLGTEPGQFRPGIDAREVRTRYGLEGGPWLLTVSRLEWHKGIDTVIRALPAIRAVHPGVRYAVAGVGPRGDELARIAGQAGVHHAVRFLGFVPDADLPALYNAADLYLGVSRYHELLAEGFGISLVEAQASGVAVVGGRSGGVADAVRDGETGVLVDPGSPAAVAEAVDRLLSDEPLRRRMGAAGRAAVETYFNWERVGRDFLRIDEEFRAKPATP